MARCILAFFSILTPSPPVILKNKRITVWLYFDNLFPFLCASADIEFFSIKGFHVETQLPFCLIDLWFTFDRSVIKIPPIKFVFVFEVRLGFCLYRHFVCQYFLHPVLFRAPASIPYLCCKTCISCFSGNVYSHLYGNWLDFLAAKSVTSSDTPQWNSKGNLQQTDSLNEKGLKRVQSVWSFCSRICYPNLC